MGLAALAAEDRQALPKSSELARLHNGLGRDLSARHSAPRKNSRHRLTLVQATFSKDHMNGGLRLG